MKARIISFVGVVALSVFFFTPVLVSAQSLSEEVLEYGQEPYSTGGLATPTSSTYAVDESLTINTGGENDVIAVGGNVEVNVDVQDTVMIAGGNVVINGLVGGDMWIMGGNVIVNGDVLGDVRIAAGNVYINAAEISGELVVASGELHVSSTTTVRGGVNYTAGRYTANSNSLPQALTDLPKYSGWGKDWAVMVDSLAKGAAIVLVLFAIIWMVGSIISGYFALRIFPTFSEKTLRTMSAYPAKSFMVGVLTLLVAPFIALGLVVSIIGWPLLALLAALATLAFGLAVIYAQYLIGRLLLKAFGKEKTGRLLPLLVGVFSLTGGTKLLELVPLIGFLFSGLVWLGVAAWGSGAIVWNKLQLRSVKGADKK